MGVDPLELSRWEELFPQGVARVWSSTSRCLAIHPPGFFGVKSRLTALAAALRIQAAQRGHRSRKLSRMHALLAAKRVNSKRCHVPVQSVGLPARRWTAMNH